MSRWFKTFVYVNDPVEGSPDYQREICLDVNWQPGYPAYTRGAPEDCYPGEGDQFEILSAQYDDGRKVPNEVLDAIPDDLIVGILQGKRS